MTLAWHGPGSGSCNRNTENTHSLTHKKYCSRKLLILPAPCTQSAARQEPKPGQAKPSQAEARRNVPGVCSLGMLFLFFLSNDVLKWKQARVYPVCPFPLSLSACCCRTCIVCPASATLLSLSISPPFAAAAVEFFPNAICSWCSGYNFIVTPFEPPHHHQQQQQQQQ